MEIVLGWTTNVLYFKMNALQSIMLTISFYILQYRIQVAYDRNIIVNWVSHVKFTLRYF